MTEHEQLEKIKEIVRDCTNPEKAIKKSDDTIFGQYDSKALVRKQATEIAKEAVKQIISEFLICIENTKGIKNQKIVLTKKQLYEGIEILKMEYQPYLNDLITESMISCLQYLGMSDDDKVNVLGLNKEEKE